MGVLLLLLLLSTLINNLVYSNVFHKARGLSNIYYEKILHWNYCSPITKKCLLCQSVSFSNKCLTTALELLISTPTKTVCDEAGRPHPAALDSRAHMKARDGGMEWWEHRETQEMNRNTHWDPAVHSSRCKGKGGWWWGGRHMGSIHWIKLSPYQPMRWRPSMVPMLVTTRLSLGSISSGQREAEKTTATTAERHKLSSLLPTVWR